MVTRIVAVLAFVVLPPMYLHLARDVWPNAGLLLLLLLFTLQLVLVWEMLYALLRFAPTLVPRISPGSTTSIISVLLDNERGLILDTLRCNLASLLLVPGDEIIVAYRSQGDLPEEEQLKLLARTNPSIRLMKIVEGDGKSEQMNQAVESARNATIRFLDADAIVVQANGPAFALADKGAAYQFTQGTNLIRNSDSVLARIAGVEYVIKYLVAQYSRYHALGLTYFCGSNGTWQKSTIASMHFSSASLVEDVEASLRADIAGCRGAYIPMMLSTELAPNRLSDWWHQRKRWAHGWFEVGALHWRALFSCNMSLPKKMNWIYLIWIRRGLYSTIYCWFLLYVVASLAAGILGPALCFLGMLFWQWLLAGAQALVARRQLKIVSGQELPMLHYVAAFPAYDALKNLVTWAGCTTWLVGSREWRVTPRR
jgi:hypothetical protein